MWASLFPTSSNSITEVSSVHLNFIGGAVGGLWPAACWSKDISLLHQFTSANKTKGRNNWRIFIGRYGISAFLVIKSAVWQTAFGTKYFALKMRFVRQSFGDKVTLYIHFVPSWCSTALPITSDSTKYSTKSLCTVTLNLSTGIYVLYAYHVSTGNGLWCTYWYLGMGAYLTLLCLYLRNPTSTFPDFWFSLRIYCYS